MINGAAAVKKPRSVDRWRSLAVGLLLELAAGTVYGFGCYSEKIKELLGNRQSAVNLVSSVGQVGLYVGIFGGLFYDRFGGAATALIGGTLSAFGYALAYVATLGIGLPATTTSMCVFYFIAWHGSGYMDTSSVCTYCKNFPLNKGSIIGLNKSFFGLSGSFVAQVSVGLFGGPTAANDGVPLLIFLATLVFAIALLCPFLLHLDSERARHRSLSAAEWWRVYLGYAILLLLSAYLAAIGVARTHSRFSELISIGTTVGTFGLIALLAAILACGPGSRASWPRMGTQAAAAAQLLDRGQTGEGAGHGPVEGGVAGVAVEGEGEEVGGERTTICKPQQVMSMHNCTAAGALGTAELYLLWAAMFCGTGPGLMVLSNVAQIAMARAGAYTADHTACHTKDDFDTLSATFTTVCGVGNCIGRVLGGFISDRVDTPSRPAWFALCLLLLAASQLMMARIEGVVILYTALSLCFLAYGAFWSLMPVLVAELFGERSIGTIYTIIGLAPASASFAVTVGIASTVYHAHVPRYAPPLCAQTVGMQSGKCFGMMCYRDTFYATTGLCILGLVLATVLAGRMRPFYHRGRTLASADGAAAALPRAGDACAAQPPAD